VRVQPKSCHASRDHSSINLSFKKRLKLKQFFSQAKTQKNETFLRYSSIQINFDFVAFKGLVKPNKSPLPLPNDFTIFSSFSPSCPSN